MVVKMFNNAFRNSVAITRTFCSSISHQTACYNHRIVNFSFLARARCVYFVLANRCYCTANRSEQITAEYNKKFEEKLNEYLKDPSNLMQYNKLKLEIEIVKSSSGRVPTVIKPRDWYMMLTAPTKGRRRAYLEYIWKLEMKEANTRRKKEQKKLEREQRREELPDISKDDYGLNRNTMFLRIYDTKMMQLYNSRLINAMLYEPTLVFDLGYNEYMSNFEAQNCAKQLLLSFSENRVHDCPFNLYFCNADRSSFVMEKFHTVIPTLYDDDFPLNITSKSYLEVFDKDKLVYLTPHTNNVLKHFDPNMIYIIGAMVDKLHSEPISMAKAKKEGIRMVQLPLSQNLEWGGGSRKSLPLNQVLKILLDLRKTNNWKMALENIPKRKLRQARESALQKQIGQKQQLIQLLTRRK